MPYHQDTGVGERYPTLQELLFGFALWFEEIFLEKAIAYRLFPLQVLVPFESPKEDVYEINP
ncbi:hypothetical protein H6F98_07270 [Microcoleus sp. FACHB-SPT15]|uniref:hypothetical protein n=1 Tax=Microcoleus sp. FACHB-SPT15 TaxID=2692830 RepID=UPI00177D58CD|nr:hypothetical protein [Microcoleus sp. FACHB-SPT15]MBD1805248.1 hypothetical protein [Microcoleus sp. FACHB-SPT15]